MVSLPQVSAPVPAESAAPVLFGALVDDAGLFPPEELDMTSAVIRHRRDQAQASRVLTHRFVIPAGRLTELQSQLIDGDRFEVSVITVAESAAITFVTDLIAADDRLSLAGIETPLPNGWLSSPETIENGLRQLPPAVPVFVEIPTGGDTE